ncbi:MAG: alpha/beta hydrolase [Clostridiaceae bacterium]
MEEKSSAEIKKCQKPRNVKKVILFSFLSILIIPNLIFFAAGNYFYKIIINWNKTANYAIGYEGEAAEGAFNVQRFNSLQKEYVTLDSRYGYKISGIFIENAAETKNTVILVHGIGQDKWNSLKFGDVFLDHGYNIFVYDSRNHGETGGEQIGYGYYEKDDLQTCVQYIKNKNPGGIIGIHGESLGASTAMLYAETYADDKDISFLVEDSGWSDLRKLYIARAADFNVPGFLRPTLIEYLSFVCYLRSGFLLENISPLKDIDKITIPVLFIHGDCDTDIPTQMGYDLYNNKKNGIKALYIVKSGKHGLCIDGDKPKYKEEVINFLNSIRY